MADPRKTVAHDENGARYETFKIDNSTITYDETKARGAAASMLDKALKLSAADTVALAADGDAVIGRLDGVESDNMARVQVAGFCKFPGGNSASLTLGKKFVGAVDGSSNPGYIRETNTATAAENGKSRGRIVNAADTTAVVVEL